MSVQAISAAFALNIDSPTVKLVLLGLANYSDANGRCYPSQKTLSDVTSLSERSVRGAIDVLERDGLIRKTERRRHNGSRASDLIDLVFLQPADAAGSDEEIYMLRPSTGKSCRDNRQLAPNQPAAPAGLTTFEPLREPLREESSLRSESVEPVEVDANDADEVIDPPYVPEPRITKSIPAAAEPAPILVLVGDVLPAAPKPKRRVRAAPPLDEDAFERWWTAYPRKVDKKDGRIAFARACAKIQGPEPPIEVLMRAVNASVQSWRFEGRELKYIPHPTTWLNRESWEDEHGPGPGGGEFQPVSRATSDFERKLDNMAAGALEALNRRRGQC